MAKNDDSNEVKTNKPRFWSWEKPGAKGRGTMRSQVASYGVLSIAVLSMVFIGICTPTPPGTIQLGGIAAEVDGHSIKRREFQIRYDEAASSAQRGGEEVMEQRLQNLAKNTLDDLVEREVGYVLARQAGVVVSREKMIEAYSDMIKSQSTEDFDARTFRSRMLAQGMTEADLERDFERQGVDVGLNQLIYETSLSSRAFRDLEAKAESTKLTIEALELAPKDINVSIIPTEIDAFLADPAQKSAVEADYQRNFNSYNSEKQVRASHILVAHKDSRNVTGDAAKRSPQDAKARAEKALAEVKANPTRFADLVQTYTDEPNGKESKGDLGMFSYGDMEEPFSKAAFALQANQVSDIVETPFGYHIIKVTEVKEAIAQPLEEVQLDIAKKLLSEKKKLELLEVRSKEVLEAVKAGKAAPLLTKYDLSWKKSDPFSPSASSIPGLGIHNNIDQILTLKSKGEVLGEVIKVGNRHMIVRLSEIKNEPKDKTKDEDQKPLEVDQRIASSVRMVMPQVLKAKLEDKGKIWLNKEYLALDQRKRPTAAQ